MLRLRSILGTWSLLAASVLCAPISRQSISSRAGDRNGTNAFGPLRFQQDGTFQISIFEDLHFGENAWDAWGPQQDLNSVKVMNEILDKESPELVVLNGDLITGENTFLQNSTSYIDQIVGPLVSRNLTWAATYGNHDSQYNLARADILARERLWPNALTTQMVFGNLSGVSNYYLPVFGANCIDQTGASCTPELLLWFFDSRGGFYFQQVDASGNRVGQPDWVDTSVVEWFEQTSADLRQKYQKVIPSLGFVHIPTNASLALQEHGVDANREPGVNEDYLLSRQGQGWCPNGVNDGTCSYGGQDVPFMRAITRTPGLMALFSGHDHGDTWCYKWEGLVPGMNVAGNGINLCFGQRSGYGGYGSWIRGARQVMVSLDKLRNFVVDTHIRLESGDVVGSVSLNETYGQDKYPATPNDRTHCATCVY